MLDIKPKINNAKINTIGLEVATSLHIIQMQIS
jgi:hypothetical protein